MKTWPLLGMLRKIVKPIRRGSTILFHVPAHFEHSGDCDCSIFIAMLDLFVFVGRGGDGGGVLDLREI